jgi:hypothetical protein
VLLLLINLPILTCGDLPSDIGGIFIFGMPALSKVGGISAMIGADNRH